MDYNNNSFGNNSWESGVKFKEEKKHNKFIRFIGMLMAIFFTASLGGIIGAYYVKKNYDDPYKPANITSSDSNLSAAIKAASIPKSSITEVAEEVGPAVVGVSNNISFWGETREQGSGSGIIFDKRGYIVTNYHVIEGASNVTVTLAGGKKVAAEIVGSDETTDLAVLQIKVENLPVAKFGDSSAVRVGEPAIAIGNPLGEEFAGTVTAGIISGVNRAVGEDGETYKYIQTDASINPGNSGGALCNISGEVIAINTLKLQAAEGMGFAIPINEAKVIIEELIQKGYVSRPQIGIRYSPIDRNEAQYYGIPVVGAGIQLVIEGSPADIAGIKPNDVIVAADGVEFKDGTELKAIMKKHKIGDVINIRIWRNGKYIDMKVKVGDSKK